MRTLEFADDMLIWENNENEIWEKLKQSSLILLESRLSMNMVKTVTVEISEEPKWKYRNKS